MGIDITYIVPVYNTMPYLKKTVKSLAQQNYPAQAIELIFVDDGSSDGSAEFLDARAAKIANMQVVHTPHSGGPGRPRNIALGMARGEYVFFCDADDWMEPDATSRMLAHAREWESDVLFVKPYGHGGRYTARALFAHSQPQVSAFDPCLTDAPGPCKLFRSSLLERENLRFDETLAVWEDQPFVFAALLAASTISIAADGVYSHITQRENSAMSARTTIGMDSVMAYARAAFATLGSASTQDTAAYATRIMREALYYLALGARDTAPGAWKPLFEELHKLVAPYEPYLMLERLPMNRALLIDVFCRRDHEACIDMAQAEAAGTLKPFEDGKLRRRERGGIELEWGICRQNAVGAVPFSATVRHIELRDDVLTLQGTVCPNAFVGAEGDVMVQVCMRDMPTHIDTPLRPTCADMGNSASDDSDGHSGGHSGGHVTESYTWEHEVSLSELVALGNPRYWDFHLYATYTTGRFNRSRIFCTRDTSIRIACEQSPRIVPYITKDNTLSLYNTRHVRYSIQREGKALTAMLKSIPASLISQTQGCTLLLDSCGKHCELAYQGTPVTAQLPLFTPAEAFTQENTTATLRFTLHGAAFELPLST